MKTRFIEATQNIEHGPNWGKFMVAKFQGEEWTRQPQLAMAGETYLLRGRGIGPEHVLVVDLQTGEGSLFLPGGSAHADLEKHAVWVCPMFEPFLEWLYTQDLSDIDKLPGLVELPNATFALSGYRRPGPEG